MKCFLTVAVAVAIFGGVICLQSMPKEQLYSWAEKFNSSLTPACNDSGIFDRISFDAEGRYGLRVDRESIKTLSENKGVHKSYCSMTAWKNGSPRIAQYQLQRDFDLSIRYAWSF
jgi:hypothetical protein